MTQLKELYLTLETENKYNDLDEMVILTQILEMRAGSVESVISNIINQAVLTHMNLNIDSTIMQMLVLNDYLINSFIKNFDRLMHNYIICYLESQGIEGIQGQDIQTINSIVSGIDMKTELETLIHLVNKQWHLIK
ncbi:hypothetical protein [Cellulosilyticum sp. I15G10I2]|uniref:hypothetical protein n=1 Tax=Cellulosilyticum sp. I15G10I2 TaxID=1892843 RepID=UPI00085BF1AE|nr:hypothetical protein [Cellulosilyticum sp. I15G10I2]